MPGPALELPALLVLDIWRTVSWLLVLQPTAWERLEAGGMAWGPGERPREAAGTELRAWLLCCWFLEQAGFSCLERLCLLLAVWHTLALPWPELASSHPSCLSLSFPPWRGLPCLSQVDAASPPPLLCSFWAPFSSEIIMV